MSFDDSGARSGGVATSGAFDPSIPLPVVDDRPIRYTVVAQGADTSAVELLIAEKPPLGVVWESGAILCAALQV